MQRKPNAFIRLPVEAWAHRLRCENLPPLQAGEADRLVTAYLAARSVTMCPARCAAPVEQLIQPLSGAEQNRG
jgi:hypothetical protein